MINTKLFERKLKYSEYNKGELAKKAGISPTALYLIITGRVVPNVETAIRISNLINADIKELWSV